jgi:hypothetical protein
MKPLYVISCPIDTYSGYGSRSRDLVKAIIELDNTMLRFFLRDGETLLGTSSKIIKSSGDFKAITS